MRVRRGGREILMLDIFIIKERIDDGEIRLSYLPTQDMLADLMTKPIQGKLFSKLRNRLLGVIADDGDNTCSMFILLEH